MKKIKQTLSQIFDDNFDCYAEYDTFDEEDLVEISMSKDKFIEVVTKFLEQNNLLKNDPKIKPNFVLRLYKMYRKRHKK